MWIKTHMSEAELFEPDRTVFAMQQFLNRISDAQENIDVGTIVNLIKGMYMIRESRDTMIGSSLGNSIEVMLRMVEIYISGKGDLV